MEYIFKLSRFFYIILIYIINLLLKITPFNFLRLSIFYFIGVKYGRGLILKRNIRIDFPWRLKIGDNCYISEGVYLDCRGGGIVIGNSCDISMESIVFTLTHDIESSNFSTKKGDVVINSRCWICARSIVLPGSEVGEGSVLAANSVFSGKSEKYSLLVGIPARLVKKLNTNRSINVRSSSA